MASKAVFVPRPEGVSETLNEEPAVKAMQDACAVIMASIIRSVPVGSGAYLRGFQKTFRADVEKDSIKGAVGHISTDDPFYHLVEFGSANNEAYHPFGRGVMRSGVEFKPVGSGP